MAITQYICFVTTEAKKRYLQEQAEKEQAQVCCSSCDSHLSFSPDPSLSIQASEYSLMKENEKLRQVNDSLKEKVAKEKSKREKLEAEKEENKKNANQSKELKDRVQELEAEKVRTSFVLCYLFSYFLKFLSNRKQLREELTN